MATTARPTARDKVRAHGERLRKQGLRPVQIWVPDVRSKAFARAVSIVGVAALVGAKRTGANAHASRVGARPWD